MNRRTLAKLIKVTEDLANNTEDKEVQKKALQRHFSVKDELRGLRKRERQNKRKARTHR